MCTSSVNLLLVLNEEIKWIMWESALGLAKDLDISVCVQQMYERSYTIRFLCEWVPDLFSSSKGCYNF